jgi:hypothetical protein
VDEDPTLGDDTQGLETVSELNNEAAAGTEGTTRLRWLMAALALAVIVAGALIGAAVATTGGEPTPDAPEPAASVATLPPTTSTSQLPIETTVSTTPTETQPLATVPPATSAATTQVTVPPTTRPSTASTTLPSVPTSTSVAQHDAR